MTRQHPENNIRRLENGSIDHAFYMQCGRIERSRQTFTLFGLAAKLRLALFQGAGEKESAQSDVGQFSTLNCSTT